jgi:predicted ArsR family transcriptional regulator
VPSPAAFDPRTYRALAGRSRWRVLEHLRASGAPLSATEVAGALGLHANTVRLHLDQLTEAGLVARQRDARGGPGRPRLLFTAGPPEAAPPTEQDDGYRGLAAVLAARLEEVSAAPADDARGAGRSWARSLAGPAAAPVAAAEATARLIATLDELGFAPVATADGSQIDLHRCPFQQVAERHADVVCGVHLGLMQGLLDDLAAPVHAARLEPFVAPGLCRAHLVRREPSAAHDVPAAAGTAALPTEGF